MAKVYLEDGNKAYRKGESYNAIQSYTEGIQVNCRDKKLNAKLHSNRATVHFYLGKIFLISLILFPLYLFRSAFYCRSPFLLCEITHGNIEQQLHARINVIRHSFSQFTLQAKKFLKCDWLRPVVFQPTLKYLHAKISVSMAT